MKRFAKPIASALIAICLIVTLPGCLVTTHMVGEGGTYDGKDMKQYDVKKKKWYLFSGIPLDDVQPHTVAGGAKNYTVRETLTFGDLLLGALTLGIAQPRTIRVSKSEAEK